MGAFLNGVFFNGRRSGDATSREALAEFDMHLWALVLTMPLAAEPNETEALLNVFRQEFVAITPGQGRFPASFTMGSDTGPPAQRPAHEVRLPSAFAMAKYEIPQNLWEAVTGRNPSRWTGPRNSVEMLTHAEAEAFCRRATELMRTAKLIKPTQVIRLPSEAEWEYCARAGTDTAYSFGDDLELLDAHGWHTGNAAGNDPPVGALKPNPWGLYDMHGYLWEWCADAGHDDYQGAPADGRPWRGQDAKRCVIRGGSWKDPARSLTSRCRSGKFRHATPQGAVEIEFRGGVDCDLRDDAVGLRCVLSDQ